MWHSRRDETKALHAKCEKIAHNLTIVRREAHIITPIPHFGHSKRPINVIYLPGRIYAMFVGDDFPEFRPNLVPTLPRLDVHNFTHASQKDSFLILTFIYDYICACEGDKT